MPASPTPAQSEASRANGARSSGPATPEGRARAAQNGVRHGLRGGFRLLPHEDEAAFEALRADLRGRHAPVGEAEGHWVDELARAAWRQSRLFALEEAAMAAALAGGGEGLPSLATLARYRARIERDARLAGEQLAALRAARPRVPRGAHPDVLRWVLARVEARQAEAAAGAGTAEPEQAGPATVPGSAPHHDRAAAAEPAAATPALNRAQRRRLAALERRRAA